MRNFVLFLQFKKRKKHPCRSVTFSKATSISVIFTESKTPTSVFLTILNCINGTKPRKAASHLENTQISVKELDFS